MSSRQPSPIMLRAQLVLVLFSSLATTIVVGCGSGGGGGSGGITKSGLQPKNSPELAPPVEIKTGLTGVGAALTISADGKHALACCDGRKRNAELWNLETRTKTKTYDFDGPRATAYAVAMSPDGKVLAFANHAGSVTLVDAASGNEIRLLQMKDLPVFALAPFVRFSPKGDLLLFASNQRIVAWAMNGKEKFQVRTQRVSALSDFFEDGKKFATGDDNGNIAIWKIGRRSPLKTLVHHGGGRSVTFVGVGKDGKTLVSNAKGEGGNVVNVWNIADGTKSAIDLGVSTPFLGHGVLTPDGKNYIYSTVKGTLAMTDLNTGERVYEWAKLPGAANQETAALALTADGANLITLAGDKTIRIWDIKNIK